MKFIDYAEIRVKAGDGGPGMAHFRREKFLPFGGPDGGNGGDGGDLYIEADENFTTLLDFKYQRFHEAHPGVKGGTNNRYGRRGEDHVLKVPCGTVVTDIDTETVVGEVLTHGQRLRVAQGGKGGIGNAQFASAKNQAPTRIIPPTVGEQRQLRFELKLIADVGIIGAPNAGKSTLISVISAARPKVADYPFTTLVPHLGVVRHKDADPFVIADVPGLIPGASEGKGLGHDFLKHIERTRTLIHLIDGSQETAAAMIGDFEGILKELELFNADLLNRPRLTVISKVDTTNAVDAEGLATNDELNVFRTHLRSKNIAFIEISSAARKGIDDLLDKVVHTLSTIAKTKEPVA